MDTKDRPGACIVCHRDMVIEKVADGKLIKIFAPYKTHATFLMNNGDVMTVSMCVYCRDSVNFDDATVKENIMKSAVEGWEYQVNKLVDDASRPDWNRESADIYLERQRQYSIVRRIGDL